MGDGVIGRDEGKGMGRRRFGSQNRVWREKEVNVPLNAVQGNLLLTDSLREQRGEPILKKAPLKEVPKFHPVWLSLFVGFWLVNFKPLLAQALL